MLIRIKFSKTGAVKFIGHLDTMRYFQKVLFRTALPVRYSEGFNPHPILEFANPLGVGISSSGEYLDFELTEDMPAGEIEKRLKAALTDGFELIRVSILNDRIQGVKKASAMSLVDVADYLVYLEPLEHENAEALKDRFLQYFARDKIIISSNTKKSERTFDLKEHLFGFAFSFEEFSKECGFDPAAEACSIKESCNGFYLYLRLSSGSSFNIRPELILNDIDGDLASKFYIHRIELFHQTESGVLPLWAVK